MTAKEVSRLAAYVRTRYGCGICASPRVTSFAPDTYCLDIHIEGDPAHLWVREFRRSAIEACIDALWLLVYPDIV
jgi:hypothetical protein